MGRHDAPTDRICRGCGQPFTPARRNQHYHGNTCRQRAWYSRTRVTASDAWPPDFEAAEEALLRQVRRGEAVPDDALLRIVKAWGAAA